MSTPDDAQQLISQAKRVREQMRGTIVSVGALQDSAAQEMGRRAPASLDVDDQWLIDQEIPLLYRAEARARMADVRAEYIAVIEHVGWAQRIMIPYALDGDERDNGIESYLPHLAPEAVSAVQYTIAIEQRLRADPWEYLAAMQTAHQTAETAILVARQHRTDLTEQLDRLHGLRGHEDSGDEDASEV